MDGTGANSLVHFDPFQPWASGAVLPPSWLPPTATQWLELVHDTDRSSPVTSPETTGVCQLPADHCSTIGEVAVPFCSAPTATQYVLVGHDTANRFSQPPEDAVDA